MEDAKPVAVNNQTAYLAKEQLKAGHRIINELIQAKNEIAKRNKIRNHPVQ
jgi:hypothetical protein